MKNFIVTNLVLCAIFLFQCKYDNIETLENDCESIGAYGTGAIYDTLLQTFPCFNPANPNEFLFVESRKNTPQRIYKYNFSTLMKTLIFEGVSLFPPKWGKSDWILLGIDGNIWKIKSEGSDFTQLTFSGKDYSPEWVGEDKFVTDHKEAQAPMIMYDLNGVALDTFSNGYSGVSCSYWGNRIIFGSGDAYKTIHLANDSLTSIPYGVTIKGANVIFIGENEVMRSDFLGIYRRNLNELKDIWVHDACTSRFYGSPSYSPQRNQVLWEKVTIDDRNNFVRSRFVIMNIDGTGEEELVIP